MCNSSQTARSTSSLCIDPIEWKIEYVADILFCEVIVILFYHILPIYMFIYLGLKCPTILPFKRFILEVLVECKMYLNVIAI